MVGLNVRIGMNWLSLALGARWCGLVLRDDGAMGWAGRNCSVETTKFAERSSFLAAPLVQRF